MTDQKDKNQDPKKTDVKSEDVKVADAKAPKEEKNESKIENILGEVKKDDLGLEELPEEIKKKLEKKKAENQQKHAKKGRKIKKKKKTIKNVPKGKAFITATYNNTIVTLTDQNGNVISWASAGVAGFKGPKKSTPYAASIITRIAVGKAKEEFGLSEVEVYIKGVGTGRESAIRSLNSNGLMVTAIRDITPIPHNGCRARKPRRI